MDDDYKAAKHEYRDFLDKHKLDGTPELAAVFYTAKSRIIMEKPMTFIRVDGNVKFESDEYSVMLRMYDVYKELAGQAYYDALLTVHQLMGKSD